MVSPLFRLVLLVLLLAGGLSACTTPPAPTPSPPPLPEITWVQPPESLCRVAAHIRLRPRIQGVWPDAGVVRWALTEAAATVPLAEGVWAPDGGELLIPFPENAALSPGEYAITLWLEGESLARHTFTIAETAPAILQRSLALTPTGPAVLRLAEGTRVFYLRYAYEGACVGAPIWATVRHADAILCTHRGALPQAAGVDWIACYREDGAPLVPGRYAAELALMGASQSTFFFDVDAPLPTPTPLPTPPPTPTPIPLHCDPLFIAAGLAPDGTPHLPGERFEWYTQVVHAGSQCESLPLGTRWASRWFRNGQPIHAAEGTWAGAEGGGLLWDSLSGDPFLLPGTYSVTLAVADTLTLTGQFRLIGYTRPEPDP